MIDFLRGRLFKKDPTHVVIDVGGVGYKVNISLSTFSEIKDKEDIQLLTYLHIKEDSHTLFGFNKESEKTMFLYLLSISGVGPSTALMIQSSLSASELKHAIASENVNIIKSVKGVGAKTAQRIILELKDKILKMEDLPLQEDLSSNNILKKEALSALTTLGINRLAAEKQVDLILKQSGEQVTLEELIKQVLKKA